MTIGIPHPDLAKGAHLDPASTRALIAAYKPVDVMSIHYQRQYLALIDNHPDLFANRFNYHAGVHGHMTASAYVYHSVRNAIALLHHKKLDIWVGPGGHVEPGDDSLAATALREAIEEGGFQGLRPMQHEPMDLDIHGFPAKGDQPDHLHYDARFLFTTDDDTFHLNEAEALKIEWVKIGDLRTKMPMWLANSRVVRHLENRFGV